MPVCAAKIIPIPFWEGFVRIWQGYPTKAQRSQRVAGGSTGKNLPARAGFTPFIVFLGVLCALVGTAGYFLRELVIFIG